MVSLINLGQFEFNFILTEQEIQYIFARNQFHENCRKIDFKEKVHCDFAWSVVVGIARDLKKGPFLSFLASSFLPPLLFMPNPVDLS